MYLFRASLPTCLMELSESHSLPIKFHVLPDLFSSLQELNRRQRFSVSANEHGLEKADTQIVFWQPPAKRYVTAIFFYWSNCQSPENRNQMKRMYAQTSTVRKALHCPGTRRERCGIKWSVMKLTGGHSFFTAWRRILGVDCSLSPRLTQLLPIRAR